MVQLFLHLPQRCSSVVDDFFMLACVIFVITSDKK